MNKFLIFLYWLTFALAITAFWISLRSEEDNIQYTLLALILWAIAYFFHWLSKKYKNQ